MNDPYKLGRYFGHRLGKSPFNISAIRQIDLFLRLQDALLPVPELKPCLSVSCAWVLSKVLP